MSDTEKVVRRIATMYQLDWRGRVIASRLVEYHTELWGMLSDAGWLTHVVTEVSL